MAPNCSVIMCNVLCYDDDRSNISLAKRLEICNIPSSIDLDVFYVTLYIWIF